MSQRELTFYPEAERTRDLIYSEYTSCDRSIHCLLQDNNASQYRFLLVAYREIVSRYLSGARLQAPRDFLADLTARLDALSASYHFTLEDYRSMGFHLLLRGTQACYLLTSRRESILVHDDGDVTAVSESTPGIERVPMDEGLLQEELFPDRLKDCFALYRVDARHYRNRDIILGCGEEDRSTVIEILNDPLWMQAGERRNTFSSRFITRKVLALRFDESPDALLAATAAKRAVHGRAWRRAGLALAGGAAVVVLIGALVRNDALTPWKPSGRGTAMMEMPVEGGAGLTVQDEAAAVSSQAVTQADDPGVVGATSIFHSELIEAWKKTFHDPVTSSPVLYGDYVVFGCRDGNAYALERSTGATLWQVPSSQGIGASPVVTGDAVILADYAGNVFAVGARDGKKRWNRKLPGRIVSSPAAAPDRLLVGCYDGNAYCLSAKDGTVLWKHGTGGRVRASAASAGDRFLIASYDGYLYALDASNGSRHWRQRIGGNISSAPAVYKDMVVVGGPDGNVYAVSLADGTLRWKYRTGGAVKGTATIAEGLVYVGSNDRQLHCVRASDGTAVWRYATGGVVLARPVVRAGVVYVGSYDSYMYCFDAENGTLVDRFRTDGEIYSSPAADENAVYFGNNKGRFISLSHSSKDAS